MRRVGGAPAVAAVGVLGVLAAAAIVGWGGLRPGQGACAGIGNVNIAAAPEIAPAVQALVDTLSTGRASTGCAHYTVTVADPADVTALIAQQAGSSLTGLGQPPGTLRRPDIWIPDSSIWLQRLRAQLPEVVPLDAPSIAQTPLVLAMPEPVAQRLGWPGTALTWSSVLPMLLSESRLRPGIVDPTRDVSGLAGLLALRAAAATPGSNAQQITVGGMRHLATGVSSLRADVLSEFPRATDARTLGESVSVAPLPEQAVIAYDGTAPPVPLVALPFGSSAPALDYPLVLLPGGRTELTDVYTGLLAAFAGTGFHNRLAAVGLRAPDGSAGSNFSTPPGTPSASPTTAPTVDPGQVDQTLSIWTAITQPARILTAIDVSASMAAPVPSAGGASREQVTVAAAGAGLALFSDAWSVGLWTFATNVPGGAGHRELVPIGPLSTNRSAHQAALAGITPMPGGQTNLYDTILAAYQRVQDGYDPARLNDVVILTDGRNDNVAGLTLETLIVKLQAIADQTKPIQLITIGIGTDIDVADLQRLTQVVGGQVFTTTDPANIGDIFLRALATRPGRHS